MLFIDALMVGVVVYYQPRRSPNGDESHLTPVVDAADVASEIAEMAGISHRTLVGDVAGALRVTPGWMPRDQKSGGRGFEQLTYSWEAFKQLGKHEMRFFFATRTTGSGDADDMTARAIA